MISPHASTQEQHQNNEGDSATAIVDARSLDGPVPLQGWEWALMGNAAAMRRVEAAAARGIRQSLCCLYPSIAPISRDQHPKDAMAPPEGKSVSSSSHSIPVVGGGLRSAAAPAPAPQPQRSAASEASREGVVESSAPALWWSQYSSQVMQAKAAAAKAPRDNATTATTATTAAGVVQLADLRQLRGKRRRRRQSAGAQREGTSTHNSTDALDASSLSSSSSISSSRSSSSENNDSYCIDRKAVGDAIKITDDDVFSQAAEDNTLVEDDMNDVCRRWGLFHSGTGEGAGGAGASQRRPRHASSKRNRDDGDESEASSSSSSSSGSTSSTSPTSSNRSVSDAASRRRHREKATLIAALRLPNASASASNKSAVPFVTLIGKTSKKNNDKKEKGKRSSVFEDDGAPPPSSSPSASTTTRLGAYYQRHWVPFAEHHRYDALVMQPEAFCADLTHAFLSWCERLRLASLVEAADATAMAPTASSAPTTTMAAAKSTDLSARETTPFSSSSLSVAQTPIASDAWPCGASLHTPLAYARMASSAPTGAGGGGAYDPTLVVAEAISQHSARQSAPLFGGSDEKETFDYLQEGGAGLPPVDPPHPLPQAVRHCHWLRMAANSLSLSSAAATTNSTNTDGVALLTPPSGASRRGRGGGRSATMTSATHHRHLARGLWAATGGGSSEGMLSVRPADIFSSSHTDTVTIASAGLGSAVAGRHPWHGNRSQPPPSRHARNVLVVRHTHSHRGHKGSALTPTATSTMKKTTAPAAPTSLLRDPEVMAALVGLRLPSIASRSSSPHSSSSCSSSLMKSDAGSEGKHDEDEEEPCWVFDTDSDDGDISDEVSVGSSHNNLSLDSAEKGDTRAGAGFGSGNTSRSTLLYDRYSIRCEALRLRRCFSHQIQQQPYNKRHRAEKDGSKTSSSAAGAAVGVPMLSLTLSDGGVCALVQRPMATTTTRRPSSSSFSSPHPFSTPAVADMVDTLGEMRPPEDLHHELGGGMPECVTDASCKLLGEFCFASADISIPLPSS